MHLSIAGAYGQAFPARVPSMTGDDLSKLLGHCCHQLRLTNCSLLLPLFIPDLTTCLALPLGEGDPGKPTIKLLATEKASGLSRTAQGIIIETSFLFNTLSACIDGGLRMVQS